MNSKEHLFKNDCVINLGIFKINEYHEPEGLYLLTPQKKISKKDISGKISNDVLVRMERELYLAFEGYFATLKDLDEGRTNEKIIIEEQQKAFEDRLIKALSKSAFLDTALPASEPEPSPKLPPARTTRPKPVVSSWVQPQFDALLTKGKKQIAKNAIACKFNQRESELKYELIETILRIIKESVSLPKCRGNLPYHIDAFHYAAHLLIAVGIEKSSNSRGHRPVFEKIKTYYIRKQ